MDAPADDTAVKRASPRLRAASFGALVVTRARTLGAASAAPTPWRVRAAMSQAGEVARPPSRLATVKIAQADLEGAQAPEDVAEAAAEQQQPAEGEGVGVEHPGEAGGREPEVGLDVRERDVHDGRVEHEHELGDEDDAEADGAAAGGPVGPRCARAVRAVGWLGDAVVLVDISDLRIRGAGTGGAASRR